MYKVTVKIEGMMCGMCEAHICDTIRKVYPNAKKVKASRTNKKATFVTDDPPDFGALAKAIKNTGYKLITVESVPYKRLGIFG